jgi:hypothetical protein
MDLGPKILRINKGHINLPKRGGERVAHDVAEDRYCRPGRKHNVGPSARIIISGSQNQSADGLWVFERQRGCNGRAPGVAEDDSARDAYLPQRCIEEICLSFGRPDRRPRAIAMAESGPVENDNAVFLGGHLDQAT